MRGTAAIRFASVGSVWGWIVGTVAVIGGAIAVAVSPHEPWFNGGGLSQVQQFLGAALEPDVSPDFLRLTALAALQTLAFAICGTVASLGLGFGLGVVASEVWWMAIAPRWSWGVSRVVRTALAIPRTLHEALWGVLCVELFGLDPLVAIVAIAIPFGAIVAKVFSELMDEAPRQGFDALRGAGAKPVAAFAYGILPMVWADLWSYGLYRFDCAIRSAAVLGIIGAGGLGYEIRLSLQSLRYEQLWTLLIALGGLTAIGDLWAVTSTGRSLDEIRNRQGNTGSRSIAARAGRNPWTIGAWLGAIAVIVASFVGVGADYSKLWSPITYQRGWTLLLGAWPPDWSTLGDSWGAAITVLRDTAVMSIVAIAIAGVGGIIFAFLGSQQLGNTASSGTSRRFPLALLRIIAVRGILLAERAVPAPVWALLCLFILFPGILPGAIALGIHNMGVLGRLMAEVVDNLDQRPLDGLRTTGAGPVAIFFYGVLPQTLPRFLGYILYRWEVCLRATIIVGLVGAGGLGRIISEALSSFHYAGLSSALIALFGLTLMGDTVSQLLRRQLRDTSNPC